VDPRFGNAFAQQIGVRAFLRREQQIRDLIGEDAIDLFRHRAVETAQARFHVYYGHAFLDRDERAGERRVHVADDEHGRWPLAIEHGLEAPHDLGGLHGVRSGADLQIDVGVGYAERGEVLAVHFGIVMLAGMHKQHRDRRVSVLHRADHGRNLHEIGTRSDHAQYRAAIAMRLHQLAPA
jgi:hypothetical protein